MRTAAGPLKLNQTPLFAIAWETPARGIMFDNDQLPWNEVVFFTCPCGQLLNVIGNHAATSVRRGFGEYNGGDFRALDRFHPTPEGDARPESKIQPEMVAPKKWAMLQPHDGIAFYPDFCEGGVGPANSLNG